MFGLKGYCQTVEARARYLQYPAHKHKQNGALPFPTDLQSKHRLNGKHQQEHVDDQSHHCNWYKQYEGLLLLERPHVYAESFIVTLWSQEISRDNRYRDVKGCCEGNASVHPYPDPSVWPEQLEIKQEHGELDKVIGRAEGHLVDVCGLCDVNLLVLSR